ncbi:hypothetical protein [Prosthecobacter sp.]|uniref:hypothetical protein n=1 Tax=Prosthecobacter sp. TaxID=1965333 RepID=UPI003783CED0
MKTHLLKATLLLLALTSLTTARAGESFVDRVREALKDPPRHGPPAVAAVRG